MPSVDNVTVGKPQITGSIFAAPVGTTLPTSVNDTLAAAFSEMGYASDAGVVNSNSPSVTSFKAWGGDVVLEAQTEKPDTFKIVFIEATNVDVLKVIYGEDNVTVNATTGEIAITANSDEQDSMSLVIDMILRNGTAKRIVIPEGKVTSVADVTYNDSTLVGYDTTFSAYPDSNGNTHYEYILDSEA